MPDAHAGLLAPALTAIRADIAARDELLGTTDWDVPDDVSRFNAAQDKVAARVPPLLAAIEAVLKLHVRQETPVHCWDHVCNAHRDKQGRAIQPPPRDCPDCRFHDEWVCQHCQCPHDEWPCPTYRAIAAALTGTQPGEASGA